MLPSVPFKFKRLLVLVALLLVVALYSQTSLYVQHKSDISKSIVDYFSEDQPEEQDILKHLTNSDLDLESSDGEDLKDTLKTHIDTKANLISQEFYAPLIKTLYSFKSQIPNLKLVRNADNAMGRLINKELLSEFLVMEEVQVKYLALTHEKIYSLLPDKFPEDLYKGTGVVFIAGGKYTWLTLLSIKSLRYFGCKLPIEVLIPTQSDYERDFCEEILPTLDAKCITLANVFGDEVMKSVKFGGYQFKSLALIASSFDNTLLLDSDNILVSNPENFFDQEPFKSFGLIVWPDYWKRTTSPHFYEIADIPINETLRVRNGRWDLIEPEVLTYNESIKYDYHEFEGTIPDVSSESGQLFIRKTDHVKTMLLSFVYNLYGPGFFYRLISQGNTGEGDKDTFLAAAVKADEKFYQVKSGIHTFGWHSPGAFHGVAMGQRNPVQDYEQYVKFMNELTPEKPGSKSLWDKIFGKDDDEKQKEKDAGLYVPDSEDVEVEPIEKPKPQFNKDGNITIFTIHSNFPKLDPLSLLKSNKLKDGEKSIRMYGDISRLLSNNKYDFEFQQFRRMKYLLCDLNLSLQYFNDISRRELCNYITEHVAFLEESPVTDEMKEQLEQKKKKLEEKEKKLAEENKKAEEAKAKAQS